MVASTVTLTPGAAKAPGVGVFAEFDKHSLTGQMLARATQGDINGWLSHVRAAAGCSRPIRLAGRVLTIDKHTKQVLSDWDTRSMPDGQIYTACGNRRASVCPSCSETYRADTYQLIHAGVAGGKGIPASVASHPAVFVTPTAPSFGYVHTRRLSKTGQAVPCRPRRKPEPCPHGVNQVCNRVHKDGEHVLGQPYCLDCYDHEHQVVWNHLSGELWRRTSIALNRELVRAAKTLGIPFIPVPYTDAKGNPRVRWVPPLRLSYAKVAEYQARGVVHFHALMRLDGHDPHRPTEILPPDPRLTREVLEDAVHRAFHATAFTTEAHPRNAEGWRIQWGEQLDVRPVHVRADGEITDTQVAGYLAKYVTKATETTGHVSRRLNSDTIDLYADDTTHVGRLILAAWELGDTYGRRPEHNWWAKLRRWAHMLGFGGHTTTKSRRYSVTMRLLRQARIDYARQEIRAADHTDDETTLIVGLLTYAGAGWKSIGDAVLANTAADLARSRARIAREEIAHEIATSQTAAAPAA
jgi:hypothetical protein